MYGVVVWGFVLGLCLFCLFVFVFVCLMFFVVCFGCCFMGFYFVCLFLMFLRGGGFDVGVLGGFFFKLFMFLLFCVCLFDEELSLFFLFFRSEDRFLFV